MELLDRVRLATESQACFRSEILRRFDDLDERLRHLEERFAGRDWQDRMLGRRVAGPDEVQSSHVSGRRAT